MQVLWVGNLKTPFEDYAPIKYINLDAAEPSTAENRAITVRLTKEPHRKVQQVSFWFSLGECGIKAGISMSRKKSLTKLKKNGKEKYEVWWAIREVSLFFF